MWRRVDLVWTDFLEEHIASIFRVEKFGMQPPAHVGFSLADFSTLKMEAIRSTETSVHIRSTRRHIPEYGILRSHRCENLKSYTDDDNLHWREFSATNYLWTSSTSVSYEWEEVLRRQHWNVSEMLHTGCRGPAVSHVVMNGIVQEVNKMFVYMYSNVYIY
jgi:hypothetical protein